MVRTCMDGGHVRPKQVEQQYMLYMYMGIDRVTVSILIICN